MFVNMPFNKEDCIYVEIWYWLRHMVEPLECIQEIIWWIIR